MIEKEFNRLIAEYGGEVPNVTENKMSEQKNDPVNHPGHYLAAAITVEPIELTARLDACIGQAVNYIVRAPYKDNSIEDLQKAIFYLRKHQGLLQFRSVPADIGETCHVLGSLFASQSSNENVKAVLSCLFSNQHITDYIIKRTIGVIERWIKYGDANMPFNADDMSECPMNTRG